MKFWGVEVKSGVSFPVKPKRNKILHLSQASLSDAKKEIGSESIYLYAIVDGKKFVLGKLSQKLPQLQFDVIFPRSFEISHSSKKCSVYFAGYRCSDPSGPTDDESESESEEEEELPVIAANNEKPRKNDKQEKPRTADSKNTANTSVVGSKQKVKIVEPKDGLNTVAENGSSDDGSPSDSSEDASDSDTNEDSESESIDGASEDDDEEEKEEDSKKVDQSKKRAVESSVKTPAPAKKAKFVTPQKTESKKSGDRVATPYPSKKDGKATPGANQSKQKEAPTKSAAAGSHSCKSCNRSFNSDNALQSHNKAKHSSEK